MQRTLYILVLIAFVLTACTPAATPTPTVAPVLPTEAPQAAAVAAATAALQAAVFPAAPVQRIGNYLVTVATDNPAVTENVNGKQFVIALAYTEINPSSSDSSLFSSWMLAFPVVTMPDGSLIQATFAQERVCWPPEGGNAAIFSHYQYGKPCEDNSLVKGILYFFPWHTGTLNGGVTFNLTAHVGDQSINIFWTPIDR